MPVGTKRQEYSAMTTNSDDYNPRARYDLPSGTYEFFDNAPSIPGLSGSGSQLAPPRRTGSTYRPAYLGEDEVVLACCHHAHEVAKAHGAREVMLEHLVHALARVAGAAGVMEDRGIHVEALRRESANVISSEIPVENTTIVAQLRASKDFNTVMYLAAATASRRDERATSVRDVLDAMLSYDPKSRAVRLIRRHATGSDMEEQIDPLREMRAVMERYSGEVRELRMTVSEMRASQLTQGSSALSLLDDRMRGVEKLMAQLVNDSTDERMSTDDRMKGLHDVLITQRTDARAVADRLVSIERVIVGQNGGLSATALQKLVETQRSDLVRIEQLVHVGLASVERTIEANRPVTGEAITVLGDRLVALEKSLETKLVDATKIEGALIERLKGFESAIEAQMLNAQRVWSGLTDRLAGIERAIGGQREEQAGFQRALSQELKGLAATVDAQATTLTSSSGLTGDHANALRQAVDGHREQIHRIETAVTDRLGGIESRLGTMGAGWAPLQDRLAGLERSIAVQRNDVAAINEALDSELEQIRKALLALSHAQQTLSTAIDEWRQNNSGDLSVISNRLGTIEKSGIQLIAAVQSPAPTPSIAAPLPMSQLVPDTDRGVIDRTVNERPQQERGNAQPSSVTPVVAPAIVVNGSMQRGDTASGATANLLDRVDRALKNRYNS
jgi:hypothetical protein